MPPSNQILIVDSSRDAIADIIKDLTGTGINAEFRVALNGGHALLHVNHLHLNKKIERTNLLIILNLHTPISNGFDFLKEFQNDKNIEKETIKIAVLKDNLTPEEIEEVETFGIVYFVSSPYKKEQFISFAPDFFTTPQNDTVRQSEKPEATEPIETEVERKKNRNKSKKKSNRTPFLPGN